MEKFWVLPNAGEGGGSQWLSYYATRARFSSDEWVQTRGEQRCSFVGLCQWLDREWRKRWCMENVMHKRVCALVHVCAKSACAGPGWLLSGRRANLDGRPSAIDLLLKGHQLLLLQPHSSHHTLSPPTLSQPFGRMVNESSEGTEAVRLSLFGFRESN